MNTSHRSLQRPCRLYLEAGGLVQINSLHASFILVYGIAVAAIRMGELFRCGIE